MSKVGVGYKQFHLKIGGGKTRRYAPTTVESFERCINGQEMSPGYTEQNGPIEQRERLEHQAGGEQ